MVLCKVTEYVLTGKEAPTSASQTTEMIKLPTLWDKSKEVEVFTDVGVTVSGQRSSNYQTVKFGVSLTVKDVDLDTAEMYVDRLEDIAFTKLQGMEPRAEQIMTELLEQV